MKKFFKFIVGAIIITVLACIVISFVFPNNLQALIDIFKK